MPKSKGVQCIEPRPARGLGGGKKSNGDCAGSMLNHSVQMWVPTRSGSAKRWSEGQNAGKREGPPDANGDRYVGRPSARESSRSRDAQAPSALYERWPSSSSRGPRVAGGGEPQPPREAWAEPQQEPVESLPPGPPEPDRAAYEEAMDSIAQDIQDLQAEFREVQSRILEQKEFTKRKAELRSELDAASDKLSQLQEHKERLMRSGIAWEEQQESVQRQEESEPPDEELQRLVEIDDEIDVLEDQMWSRRLPLAEEKRILSQIAELYRQKSALKAMEREREAKRAAAQDKVLLLRQQVDQVNEEIRALRSQKKAITQEYEELMEWRQQKANNIASSLQKQEAIGRQLQEKQQERTRIDFAFKREEQRYSRWLAGARAAAARSPRVPISLYDATHPQPQQRSPGSQARARSRPPLQSSSPSQPSRRERPLSPRQRAGRPPRDQNEDSPQPADPDAEHAAQVERKERELRDEQRFLESELESKRLMLEHLGFAIKFCNDLLKRKQPKPQAPVPNPEHSKKVDSTFDKCQKVPPKETRLQPGKDFLNEWHSSTTVKKSYQRARQIKQQQVNARSRSVEARLKQPPDLQGAGFNLRRPAPEWKLDAKAQNRVDQGWVKKTFDGTCLVRHSLADLPGAARTPFSSWRVLEQLDLPIPRSIEDVAPVVEQAESMRVDVERRVEELEKSIEDISKEKVKIDRRKKSREQSALEQESLDRVAEATEALAQIHAAALEQGLEAVSRLVRAPWRDRRARESLGRRPNLVDERARRRQEKLPTALETLKDVLAGARSVGISDSRLAEALELEARVERQANEALLGLAVEGVTLAREAEGDPNQREMRLAAKADLQHAIKQAESTSGIDEKIVEFARQVVVGKAKRLAAPEPAEQGAPEKAAEEFVDVPSEEDASGQGFW